MEDVDFMDENDEISAEEAQAVSNPSSATNEVINLEVSGSEILNPGSRLVDPNASPYINGEMRTLDGEVAGDEFEADAINYRVLLEKIDALLDRLKLDA